MNKLDFNEWFNTWKRKSEYDYCNLSQGMGLRRAHDLMMQANKDYEKYLNKKDEQQTTIRSKEST